MHPFLKFLKKLIQKQINQHIVNQLSPYLCGYGKGVGTHALLLLIERWIKIFDDKGFGKYNNVLLDIEIPEKLKLADATPVFTKNGRLTKTYWCFASIFKIS